MIKHYFLLVYRNFLRNQSYFFINIIGLTTGLACTLFIYLWVRDEYRMNRFHEKESSLYQMMEHQQYADEIMTTTSTPGLLANAIREDLPEVEYSVVTTWVNGHTLSVGENSIKSPGFDVSEQFFRIFSFPLLQGDADQVLKDKLSIVISRDLAVKLFGSTDDVLGRMVELDHDKQLQVTGVFENLPSHASNQFQFVTTFELFKDDNDWVESWGNNGPSTYVRLKEGSDVTAFNEKIKEYIKGKNKDSNVTLFAYPFADLYLYGGFENGIQSGGRIEYVRLFSIIAVFILLIACINFMNLSTARASRKAKEVGIKKSIGAARSSLIIQYLTESMVTAGISLLLAGLMVGVLLPAFNLITDKQIVFALTDWQLMAIFAGATIITGLLAGSYPALYLSGFSPAGVLKGVVRGSLGELWARKGLVVFQFFLSVVLIVSVVVIYQQISFIQNKNLGYDKEHLILFPAEGKISSSKNAFIEEVRRISGVKNAAFIGHGLLGRNSNTSGLQWEGKNPDDLILFENVFTSSGLMETMGVEMAEGRMFNDSPADTSKIILNEAAIRAMNLADPIGKHIKLWGEFDLEIVGVVKDFHFQSLHTAVNPLFMWVRPENAWNVMVRLEAGKEKEALAALGDFYKSFNPGFSFEYSFQDEQYAKLYAAEQRVATLSGIFASIAILISCLGLFGLAAFTAERRIKEIGIRKALGSSAANIVLLLSGDFTKMVLLSIVLGLPAGWWLLDSWLSRFEFHVELKTWYFLAAGFLALLIAWLTVASQAIKAARINPVKCLRSE